MATTSEIHAAGRLVGDALAGAVRSIAHVHMAIAQRAFDAVGPTGAPVRLAHDRIATGVYRAVGGAHALAPRAGAVVAAARQRTNDGDEKESWSASGRPAQALAALNGLRGDSIAARYPALALTMSLRNHGDHTDVSPDTDGLVAAFPDATSRLAVFVHGLCETDESWWQGAADRQGDPSVTYGSLLHDDLGFTPLYVRYNSGLRVADNGGALVALLDRVVAAWPVPVDEIVFVAHSMGGLVVRSACSHGDTLAHPWTPLVRHVVCLGTPHLGAPLERGVNAAVRFLATIPETQPLAAFLHDRSAGVKDLRHGVVAHADWHGGDPDLFVRERITEVPFLPTATYYFVGATVTRDRHHPVGAVIGDLLVRYPSAAGSGRHRSIPFEVEHGAHIGGLTHFALLNHPAVYEQLHRWLSAAEPPPDASVSVGVRGAPSARTPSRPPLRRRAPAGY